MQTIELSSKSGKTVARIAPEIGFNLFSILVGDTELLWSAPNFLEGGSSPSGSGTPILFPFPGRLNGRSFCFAGNDYHVASDDGLGNAIHGFVLNRPWRIVSTAADAVTAEFHASQDAPEIMEQWPSDFLIRCSYTAVDDGVLAEYDIQNPGNVDLPCGFGTHAYFRVPIGTGSADTSMVTCPVSEQWILKDMLATGEVSELSDDDLQTSGVAFGRLNMDDVFSGIKFKDGRATATITNPSTNSKLIYTWDEACEICVIYTPPHREAICMEPYTLVPGGLAFETGEHGLMVLKSKEAFTHKMEIRLEQ